MLTQAVLQDPQLPLAATKNTASNRSLGPPLTSDSLSTTSKAPGSTAFHPSISSVPATSPAPSPPLPSSSKYVTTTSGPAARNWSSPTTTPSRWTRPCPSGPTSSAYIFPSLNPPFRSGPIRPMTPAKCHQIPRLRLSCRPRLFTGFDHVDPHLNPISAYPTYKQPYTNSHAKKTSKLDISSVTPADRLVSVPVGPGKMPTPPELELVPNGGVTPPPPFTVFDPDLTSPASAHGVVVSPTDVMVEKSAVDAVE